MMKSGKSPTMTRVHHRQIGLKWGLKQPLRVLFAMMNPGDRGYLRALPSLCREKEPQKDLLAEVFEVGHSRLDRWGRPTMACRLFQGHLIDEQGLLLRAFQALFRFVLDQTFSAQLGSEESEPQM